MRGDLEYPLSKQRSLERGGGGYCYLLLCIDFRNYLLLDMKKNQDFFFLNCSVYFICIDFHIIMKFLMYVRCYD